MRDWEMFLALAPTKSKAIAPAQWIANTWTDLRALERLQATFRNLGFQDLWLESDTRSSSTCRRQRRSWKRCWPIFGTSGPFSVWPDPLRKEASQVRQD